MGQDLNTYLRQLGKAGRYHSEGRFTVDVKRRDLKLRHERFREPTDYLLCCVRAGVTAGAERVSIRLGYSHTVVEYKAMKTVRARELLESLLGETAPAATESLLAAALAGAFGAGCGAVSVQLPEACLRLEENRVEVIPRESTGAGCVLRFDFASTSYASRRARCLLESQAVISRCAFSPVPVLLDGLSVVDSDGWESLLRWQRSPESYGVHRDFAWVEAFLEDSEDTFPTGMSRRRCRVEYIGGERYRTSAWDPRRPGAFLRIAPSARGDRHRVGTFIRLGSRLDGPGRLYLVKQGVTLDAVEADLGAPGVAVVMRGDKLETDLSLFRPVLGDDIEALIRRARAQVRAVVSQLGRERKALSLSRMGAKDRILRRAAVFGTGGATVGLFAGPMGALMIGGACFFLGAMFEVWRNTDQVLVETERRIRWELDSFVDLVGPIQRGRTRL